MYIHTCIFLHIPVQCVHLHYMYMYLWVSLGPHRGTQWPFPAGESELMSSLCAAGCWGMPEYLSAGRREANYPHLNKHSSSLHILCIYMYIMHITNYISESTLQRGYWHGDRSTFIVIIAFLKPHQKYRQINLEWYSNKPAYVRTCTCIYSVYVPRFLGICAFYILGILHILYSRNRRIL